MILLLRAALFASGAALVFLAVIAFWAVIQDWRGQRAYF